MSFLPDGRRVDGLKVTELKKELEIRGLGRSGAKKELVARLTEHLFASENMEAEEFSNAPAQLSSPTTGTTESHSEAQSSQRKDNDDLTESSIVESDAEAADLSTGTVIFVPKESPAAPIAPASNETPTSWDPEVKTGETGDHSTSLTGDSDMYMLEPGEVLDSATDTEPTATTTVDEGQQQQEITAPHPTSSVSETGAEARTSEAQSSRRRNLWGARGDAASASQADKYPKPLVSFSTDTLEKMVPTLTVVDKKPPPVDVVPPGSGTHPASSDALSLVLASAATTEASSPAESAGPSHQPSPPPTTLTRVEKPSEVTILDSSSSEYAKEARGLHSIPDEEVVVMDATIEGGLDIDSAPVGISESQKTVVATLEEVDTRGDASVRNQDTRQVIRKRSIEAAGRERKQSPVKRKGLKETKAVGYLIEQPERVEPFQATTIPPCEFVHITCLVRPFTADQLRQTITSSYGQVVDLWLNRIKSASVVHFESKQAAINCREGLDGSRWPSINPRVLRCDFVSQEFFNWMKQYGDMADMTPPKHLSDSLLTVDPAKEARKAEDDRVGAHPGGHTRKSDDLRQKLSRRDGSSAARAIRSGASGDLSASADSQAKSEPSKMLDDLFRKTTTSPCIYWLPLTEEEARQRAAERVELAVKRDGTRATRSPFAAGGEPQRTTDTTLAVDKQPPESEQKKKTDSDAVPDCSSLLPPPEKVSSGGRQSTGRDADDQKGQQQHRRDGSPFMANEKKSDSAGRPVHRSGVAARDDGRFSGPRRQRSSRTSSSPSPKRLSRRPRPYREPSPRRRSGAGGGDYYSSGIRRRSSPSRSRSGGGGGRYRGGGGRLDSSAEAYRRRRVSSPHAHRSRR